MHKHATDFENLLVNDKARQIRMDAIHQESLDRIRKAERPIGQEDEDIFDQYLMPFMGALAALVVIVVALLW